MLDRNPIKYITNFFNESGIPYEHNISKYTITTELGLIYFISAETPERMQGIHAKGIIGDEAGLYSRLWWDTAVQRVSFNEGQILLLTTPYTMNWLKTDFYDQWLNGDPDFHVENPKSTDNPFYPVKEYERAKKMLPDWKFKMLYDAQFTKPAGLIYPEYQTCKPFEIPHWWNRYRGLDFGVNNPFATSWLAEDYDTGDYYLYNEYKKTGLDIDQVYRVLESDKDTLTYGDPENAEVMKTLYNRGVNIRKAKKDVMAGILDVQSLLKTGRLKIFDTLKNTIDELNTYQWEMDKNEEFLDKPLKKNNHLMDGLRYIVYTGNLAEERSNDGAGVEAEGRER
jgi:PBSX family phage terminase large subunit